MTDGLPGIQARERYASLIRKHLTIGADLAKAGELDTFPSPSWGSSA